ncbi:hypothetical protein [Nocardia donostiensis]|uniref:DUF732 domain-containing protein n=1 Tax=Nocardia donostiensis TaxID=1538463 RepID=A0A1W0ATL0_9NOCA|nr:hypothetical protein [Nocardia donostiensis]ONM49446.1 hypothetical protein B0T46_06100 [Nocardia donostiensis]OQS13575.1 hypothetical protein B0T36_19475 [Nocardia donostiensis]OQS19923.1 hypothetical protein B0T44_11775 [Nocardia donostiensis]
MRTTLIAAAFITLPLLAACGGGSGAEPVTAADISKSMQDKGLQDPAFADCAAKLYVDEGISQEGLRAMVNEEHDSQAVDPQTLGMSEDDADKARAATDKIIKQCLGNK